MRLLRRGLFLFGVALAVVLPVRTWVVEPIVIASASMLPALRVGQLMLLDKWTLRGRAPRRGEIVSFRSPVAPIDMVKRVIAVPGDVVQLKKKVVYLDGVRREEPYALHTLPHARLQGDDLGPLTVPPDSFFVLGDNRDQSDDSTVWRDAAGDRVYYVRRREIQGLVRPLPWLE
jgi:signal peptidase I